MKPKEKSKKQKLMQKNKQCDELNSRIQVLSTIDEDTGLYNRKYFEDGLYKAIEVLKPHTNIIYGSDNYDVFDRLRELGIKVIAFPSKTNLAFMKEGNK